MAVKKERIDVLMVEKGLVSSRERAKACIMAGLVVVDGVKIDKAGTLIAVDAVVRILNNGLPYVSRGGFKLAQALSVFDIDLHNKVLIDIGASTGGFTDCALQNGAEKVYAVDVGYGQLAWSLRNDPRVILLERTNIRHVTVEQIGELADIATIDVSFISLDKVLPVAVKLLQSEGKLIALLKPQFEAGREKVGKKGVVRDPAVHKEVILRILIVAAGLGFSARGLTYSPITGPEGNIEYLLYAVKSPELPVIDEQMAGEVVAAAHRHFRL